MKDIETFALVRKMLTVQSDACLGFSLHLPAWDTGLSSRSVF